MTAKSTGNMLISILLLHWMTAYTGAENATIVASTDGSVTTKSDVTGSSPSMENITAVSTVTENVTILTMPISTEMASDTTTSTRGKKATTAAMLTTTDVASDTTVSTSSESVTTVSVQTSTSTEETTATSTASEYITTAYMPNITTRGHVTTEIIVTTERSRSTESSITTWIANVSTVTSQSSTTTSHGPTSTPLGVNLEIFIMGLATSTMLFIIVIVVIFHHRKTCVRDGYSRLEENTNTGCGSNKQKEKQERSICVMGRTFKYLHGVTQALKELLEDKDCTIEVNLLKHTPKGCCPCGERRLDFKGCTKVLLVAAANPRDLYIIQTEECDLGFEYKKANALGKDVMLMVAGHNASNELEDDSLCHTSMEESPDHQILILKDRLITLGYDGQETQLKFNSKQREVVTKWATET